MPEFGLSYSRAAADLRRLGRIAVDRFLCPGWPELVDALHATQPIYVHFPLRVGTGTGDALDTYTHLPADWGEVERMLALTSTPYVNLHLAPAQHDLPGVAPASLAADDVERVSAALLRDVDAVVGRFGAERVIVEGGANGVGLRQALLPEVIATVVAESGCGLLLDLAHVRLAAGLLGCGPEEYLAALPVERTREVHIAGIQVIDERWAATMRAAGFNESYLQEFAGRPTDHLPLSSDDWPAYARSLDYIATRGATPWIVTLEYGGVGPVWEALTDADVLARDVPRLAAVANAAREHVVDNGR